MRDRRVFRRVVGVVERVRLVIVRVRQIIGVFGELLSELGELCGEFLQGGRSSITCAILGRSGGRGTINGSS